MLFDDAAFNNQTVCVCSLAVYAAQGGFIVCMEEVLRPESRDLIVDEGQHGLIALLYGRRDSVQAAQGFNSLGEALILDCPRENLGIIGGERVTAAVQQRIVSFRIGIKLQQRDLRIVLRKERFGGGSLGNDQRLSLQLPPHP